MGFLLVVLKKIRRKKVVCICWRNSGLSAFFGSLLLSLFCERGRKKEGRGEREREQQERRRRRERETETDVHSLNVSARCQLRLQAAGKSKCSPAFPIGGLDVGRLGLGGGKRVGRKRRRARVV